MYSIPTDQELIKEIRSISTTAPHLMMCANCMHYDMASGECDVNHLRFSPYVRGCGGKFFLTNEELLLFKVKNELTAQALDLEKIENLLALVITTACSASCFAEDLARRIKTLRKMPSHQDKKQQLRKDLDTVEDILGALARIDKIAKKMQDDHTTGIEKIDQQYRLYIERHINRCFTTNGKFDVQKSDGNLNNAMIICNVIGKFIKGCLGNPKNYKKFFTFLDSLENDTPYGLSSDDFKHYELKGYDEQ